MDLERLLLRVREEAAPPIPPEAAVARLAEHAERYAEMLMGPRFEVGDLVTPVADCGDRDAGKPHHVVEVNPEATPIWTKDCCGRFGGRPDMRVLYFAGDTVESHWVESFNYEPWTAAAAEAADVRAAD